MPLRQMRSDWWLCRTSRVSPSGTETTGQVKSAKVVYFQNGKATQAERIKRNNVEIHNHIKSTPLPCVLQPIMVGIEKVPLYSIAIQCADVFF